MLTIANVKLLFRSTYQNNSNSSSSNDFAFIVDNSSIFTNLNFNAKLSSTQLTYVIGKFICSLSGSLNAFFVCRHRKKYKGLRSGDPAGHPTFPLFTIILLCTEQSSRWSQIQLIFPTPESWYYLFLQHLQILYTVLL